MSDLISRQAAIDAIDRLDIPEDMCVFEILSHIELEIGNLPSAQSEPPEKYEYHYDHTDCIWYRPEARNRCPSTCAQYRDNYEPLEQEPRKGHWVLTDVEGNKVWHCHCSECDKDPQDYVGGSEDWWLIKSKLPKFCPSCGSDNREVEE